MHSDKNDQLNGKEQITTEESGNFYENETPED